MSTPTRALFLFAAAMLLALGGCATTGNFSHSECRMSFNLCTELCAPKCEATDYGHAEDQLPITVNPGGAQSGMCTECVKQCQRQGDACEERLTAASQETP